MSRNPYTLMSGGDGGEGYQAASAPAYDIGSLIDGSPDLEDDLRAADEELSRHDMQRVRARVVLVIDISVSMGPGERNNNFITRENLEKCPLQQLINKAVALALLFDDDGEVVVYPFGDKAYGSFVVTKDNYKRAVRLAVAQAGGLKSATNYNSVVRQIQRDLLQEDELVYQRGKVVTPQSTRSDPIFCLFATDGQHNREMGAAIEAFIKSTGQACFWKFLGLGAEIASMFSFLRDFDDQNGVFADGCLLDNCDLAVVRNPAELTMEMLVREFRGWLVAAHKLGILLNKPPVPERYLNEEDRVGSKAWKCCVTM